MKDFLGGHPVAVAIRLVIISIIVGIVLSALGITPANVVDRVQLLFRRLYDLGFGVFEWAFGYLLLGAVIVVPIWFISRVLSSSRSKTDDRS
ncbi:MAG: DUF6460 domain-containing protein [Pseudomonadota bacterium]